MGREREIRGKRNSVGERKEKEIEIKKKWERER